MAHMELDEIREYITKKFDAPQAAIRQTERILKAINAIAVFPKMYRVRRKSTGMRICPVDNYLITYYVNDEKHIISISRIIYSRRDISSII